MPWLNCLVPIQAGEISLGPPEESPPRATGTIPAGQATGPVNAGVSEMVNAEVIAEVIAAVHEVVSAAATKEEEEEKGI